MTHAGITGCEVLPMRNVALTGPSETLSYQPSLSEKRSSFVFAGDPAVPGPPTTMSLPASSVRSVASTMSSTRWRTFPAFAKAIEPVIAVAAAPASFLIDATDAITSLSRSKPALRNLAAVFLVKVPEPSSPKICRAARFSVGEVDGPLDLDVPCAGHFASDRLVLVRVDIHLEHAEARPLWLDPVVFAAERTFRRHAGCFRADDEAVLAVANAGDADTRVDSVLGSRSTRAGTDRGLLVAFARAVGVRAGCLSRRAWRLASLPLPS